MTHKTKIAEYCKQLEKFSALEIVEWAVKKFENSLVFASSMGAEDQVLTDMLVKVSPDTRIITLDTGRLFPETYQIIEKTQRYYKKSIETYFPNYVEVEKMVNTLGINLFYDSVEKRKMCCHIRKIEPLERAFKGSEAWICGLRRDQSVTRSTNKVVEWDEANQLVKINPLIDWTEEHVWEYLTLNNVPYNKLHDNGFRSIGCQPCTRAVKEGEDVRSGRWWWENPEHKECGLHLPKDKK
jgi:phosphoadenosine phosphosulfate reductase